jgi:hypothetical protein
MDGNGWQGWTGHAAREANDYQFSAFKSRFPFTVYDAIPPLDLLIKIYKYHWGALLMDVMGPREREWRKSRIISRLRKN